MVSAEEIQKPAAAKARINHPVDDRRRRYELLKRGYELKESTVQLVARNTVPFAVVLAPDAARVVCAVRRDEAGEYCSLGRMGGEPDHGRKGLSHPGCRPRSARREQVLHVDA